MRRFGVVVVCIFQYPDGKESQFALNTNYVASFCLGTNILIFRCVNYGVLSHSEAERMNKKVLDAKKKGIKSGAISPPPKKKKVKVEHDIGGDADMSTGGPEMVGSKIM